MPRVGIAVVRGRSMEPTLRDGDRLLVLYGARPRPGGIALVVLPPSETGPRPLAVKRVVGPAPGHPHHWWVERDNPHQGVDSWLFGPVTEEAIKARVLLRLPAPRRGGLRDGVR